MSRTRNLRLLWGAALTAVVVGSLMPAKSRPIVLLGRAGISDKVEHFAAYAVLMALPAMGQLRFRRLCASAALLFLLGGALELGQLLSPGRHCDWRDLLMDSWGILAGGALASALAMTCRWYVSQRLTDSSCPQRPRRSPPSWTPPGATTE